ncbi:MAG: hypothetical protein M3Y67_06910, partial [Pseudomonadota bacterium]|nr:hypothetical protein [Pseudomonadota bacterium]
MASIATLPLDFRSRDPWAEVQRSAARWALERGVEWRDAVVIVPFAQHLPLARRAWARSAAWQPRIETTQT